MTADIVKIVCGLVYVTIVIVHAAPSSKLPKGFVQCKKSDPNFDECIRSGMQSAVPHLVKGVPSLGLVEIDPLRISTLELDQSNGGPVRIKSTFKDLYIRNVKYVQITKAHFDPVNYTIYAEFLNPESILLEGDYEISGKVLVLPIIGKGKCKINLTASKYVATVELKSVVKNGKKYMEVEKLQWKFIPTHVSLKFDNLFNGDKALGDNMNVFLNENWRELLDELQPAIEDVFAIAFKRILQNFLNRIPSNEIFLD